MIVLEDRSNHEKKLLKNKAQVSGTQTWITEYPGELHARCHYYAETFSLEKVEIPDFGVTDILGFSLGDEDDYYTIKNILNETISDTSLSEEEFNCLIHKGFLQLLSLKCPEIKQNETYNLIINCIEKIQQLEKQFIGKPIENILKYIDEQIKSGDEDRKKIFTAIKNVYEQSEWRQEYLKYQDNAKIQEDYSR